MRNNSKLYYSNIEHSPLRHSLGYLSAFVLMLSAAGIAHAQSSVTLYGSIDEGITFTNNTGGAHQYRMTSGVENPSMWGLTGKEDLGGGYAAIFKLENGFNASNGALDGSEFTRQAYVGIASDKLGTIGLGRQYSPVTDIPSAYSLAGTFGPWYFDHLNDMEDFGYSYSIPNAVKYISPALYGLKVEAMYSLGGQAGAFSNNSAYSGAASYTNGSFSVGAGYIRINEPGSTIGAYLSGGGFINAVYGNALLTARDQQILTAGASYTISGLQLLGSFSNVTFQQPSSGQDLKFQNYELSAIYNLSPTIGLCAGYTFTDGHDDATGEHPRYQQINLGMNYHLSKRTGLYVALALQKASGGADAQITGINPSSDTNQIVAHIGINHTF